MEQGVLLEAAPAASDSPAYAPYVLYELGITGLSLNLSNGAKLDMSDTLSNGRSNYLLFESLIRQLVGLERTTGSDHVAANGKRFEQKAFTDAAIDADADLFQTSASSTFGANNNGPKVKAFLDAGDYAAALEICKTTGYDHNDFYVYTNTRGYQPNVPFRFVIVPKDDVITMLDAADPRLISRDAILAKVTRTEQLTITA